MKNQEFNDWLRDSLWGGRTRIVAVELEGGYTFERLCEQHTEQS